jgi:hypothetical protein
MNPTEQDSRPAVAWLRIAAQLGNAFMGSARVATRWPLTFAIRPKPILSASRFMRPALPHRPWRLRRSVGRLPHRGELANSDSTLDVTSSSVSAKNRTAVATSSTNSIQSTMMRFSLLPCVAQNGERALRRYESHQLFGYMQMTGQGIDRTHASASHHRACGVTTNLNEGVRAACRVARTPDAVSSTAYGGIDGAARVSIRNCMTLCRTANLRWSASEAPTLW